MVAGAKHANLMSRNKLFPSVFTEKSVIFQNSINMIGSLQMFTLQAARRK